MTVRASPQPLTPPAAATSGAGPDAGPPAASEGPSESASSVGEAAQAHRDADAEPAATSAPDRGAEAPPAWGEEGGQGGDAAATREAEGGVGSQPQAGADDPASDRAGALAEAERGAVASAGSDADADTKPEAQILEGAPSGSADLIDSGSALPSALPESHAAAADGAVLDGFLLVDKAGVELPEKAELVAVTSCDLSDVEVEDARFFTRLASADLSDNRLRELAPLAAFPVLKDLNLAANELTDCSVPIAPKGAGSGSPPPFAALRTLDVGYNPLGGEAAFAQLGALPALRSLAAPSCGLSSLPGSLEGSFCQLSELDLRSNSLRGSALAALAPLPCLSALRLDDNRVRRVPSLSVREDPAAPAGKSSATTPPLPSAGLCGLPFPSLESLYLCGNLLNDSPDIAALAACTRLARLCLWGNPLCTRTRALLPRGWRDAHAQSQRGRMVSLGKLGSGGSSEPSKRAAEKMLSQALSAQSAAMFGRDTARRVEVVLSEPLLPPPRQPLRDLYEATVKDACARQERRARRREAVQQSSLRALKAPAKGDLTFGTSPALMERALARLDAAVDAHGPALRAASALAPMQRASRQETELGGTEPLQSGEGVAEAAEAAVFALEALAGGQRISPAQDPVAAPLSGLGEGNEDDDDGDQVFLTVFTGGGADLHAHAGEGGELSVERSYGGGDGLDDDELRPLYPDASSALRALRFALAHPLCESGDAARPPNHQRMTASMLNRIRLSSGSKPETAPRVPGGGGGGGASVRSKVADIDSILQHMKGRLAGAERALKTAQEG